jgi:hypothetical protein
MISSRPGNASAAERSGDNITIRDKISLSFPGILWYLEDETGNFQITTGREIGAGQSVSILFSLFASSERRTQAFEIAASEEVMDANPGSTDTAKWRRKELALMINAAVPILLSWLVVLRCLDLRGSNAAGPSSAAQRPQEF